MYRFPVPLGRTRTIERKVYCYVNFSISWGGGGSSSTYTPIRLLIACHPRNGRWSLLGAIYFKCIQTTLKGHQGIKEINTVITKESDRHEQSWDDTSHKKIQERVLLEFSFVMWLIFTLLFGFQIKVQTWTCLHWWITFGALCTWHAPWLQALWLVEFARISWSI
jgi:hypothetical protein